MKNRKKTSALLAAATAFIIIVSAVVLASSSSFAQEALFTEGQALYKSYVHDPTDLTKKGLAYDVLRIVSSDPETKQSLFLSKSAKPDEADLWLADLAKGGPAAKLADGVVSAQLSPDCKFIAVWNKNQEIQLLDRAGKVTKKIDGHGAAPAISPSGKLIAYQKLAEVSFDGNEQSLFEQAQGIAVFDVSSGKETLLTTGGSDDFGAAGFSGDDKFLYFYSTRTGLASLWIIGLDGSGLRQLTNVGLQSAAEEGAVPILNEAAQWSSDGKILFGVSGSEKDIWLLRFNADGTLATAKIIAGGNNPQWYKKDKSIIFRAQHGEKSRWQILTIQ